MDNLKKIAGYITFVSALVLSCSHKNAEQAEVINYANLENMELELVLEIGSHDQYVHGLLGSMILMPDGTMLVSDGGKTTIEQFHPSGEHIATIAEEGRGPGELTSNHIFLYKGTRNELLIRHRGMYQRMDVFEREEEGQTYVYHSSHSLERTTGRSVHVIGQLSDSEFLARTQLLDIPLQEFFEGRNITPSPLVVVDILERIVLDSLDFLRIPSPVFVDGGEVMHFGTPPYQIHDRILMLNNGGYLLAKPDPSQINLSFFQKDHTLEKEMKLPVQPRPVTREDLDSHLQNADNVEMVRKLNARAGEHKPSFLSLWISDEHILLHTETRFEEKELALLNMAGSPIGKFTLPRWEAIQAIHNRQIYTLNRNPETGHAIRVYEITAFPPDTIQ